MKDLRVELRFKNATLYRALAERFPNYVRIDGTLRLGRVAEQLGVCSHRLSQLLNLRVAPLHRRNNRPIRIVEDLSEQLNVPISVLFPAHLYAATLPRFVARKYDSIELLSLGDPVVRRRLAATPVVYDDVELHSVRPLLDGVLATLTPREENVIRERFGLDIAPGSFREIGARHGVTGPRIQQIESTALRKLRHPSRAGRLRAVLGTI